MKTTKRKNDLQKMIISNSFFLVMLVLISSVTSIPANSLNQPLQETFTVTQAPAENGSYTIDPTIPADGKVKAGTVLTVKATPSSNYSLDAIYYTVQGGKWGTTSYE